LPRVFDGKPDEAGPLHIISGAAGNNEGLDKGKGVGGLIVASDYAHKGYGELSVDASESPPMLHWRYLLSETGEVVDNVSIPVRSTAARLS
jgi:hypothetical protein